MGLGKHMGRVQHGHALAPAFFHAPPHAAALPCAYCHTPPLHTARTCPHPPPHPHTFYPTPPPRAPRTYHALHAPRHTPPTLPHPLPGPLPTPPHIRARSEPQLQAFAPQDGTGSLSSPPTTPPLRPPPAGDCPPHSVGRDDVGGLLSITTGLLAWRS